MQLMVSFILKGMYGKWGKGENVCRGSWREGVMSWKRWREGGYELNKMKGTQESHFQISNSRRCCVGCSPKPTTKLLLYSTVGNCLCSPRRRYWVLTILEFMCIDLHLKTQLLCRYFFWLQTHQISIIMKFEINHSCDEKFFMNNSPNKISEG